MSDYNGWSNYPTWNIYLWASNDEVGCRIFSSLLGDDQVTAQESKEIFSTIFATLYGVHATPDGVSVDDPTIDWEQITEHLNADFR